MKKQRVTQIEGDEPLVGVETIGRMMKKANPVEHLHVANVNSTYSGGGVAELLTSLDLFINQREPVYDTTLWSEVCVWTI
jgi:trehalose synthase